MITATLEIFKFSNLTIKLVNKSKNSFDFRKGGKGEGNMEYQNLEYSTFLIFGYWKNGDENNEAVRNDVAFSYPHMFSLKDSFNNIAECILTDKVFSKVIDPDFGEMPIVTKKYEHYLKRAVGIGKSILFNFDIKENEVKNFYEQGVCLTIGDEDSSVFMNTDLFLSINMAIQEFSLLTNSQLLTNSYLANRSVKTSKVRNNITEEQV